ncbi:uncharacterized protein LOC144095459 [Amblyomma americanum]
MSSGGVATAALASRGNRIEGNDDTDYQVILPQLPTGRVVLNTLFLHGDVRVRPFRVEDFRDALAQAGTLPDVVALGAYQIHDVWAVTFKTAEGAKRLLAFKELKVKGRRCLILDPEDQQVKLRLHWMLEGVADEDIRTAFAAFGKVTDVTRERWRVQGVHDKGSTTRTVLLKLKPGFKVDDLPHQIRVAGELALVVAPGRPMQCLRCHGTGHVRRECKVPRCSKCRRYGHADSDCVRTYAVATGLAMGVDTTEHIMDVAEAEEAAKGTDVTTKPALTTQSSGHPSGDRNTASGGGKEPGTVIPAGTNEGSSSDGASHPAKNVDQPPTSEEQMDQSGARVTTVAAPAKRPHDPTDNEGDEPADGGVEQPPAKTGQSRRPTLRPTPNLAAGKRVAEKAPPLPPQQNQASAPDGSGGGNGV